MEYDLVTIKDPSELSEVSEGDVLKFGALEYRVELGDSGYHFQKILYGEETDDIGPFADVSEPATDRLGKPIGTREELVRYATDMLYSTKAFLSVNGALQGVTPERFVEILSPLAEYIHQDWWDSIERTLESSIEDNESEIRDLNSKIENSRNILSEVRKMRITDLQEVLREHMEEKWRKPFLEYIETGESTPELDAYIDSNPHCERVLNYIVSHMVSKFRETMEES